MIKKLIPDVICESVFNIDLDKLKVLGISGLLIDIDNTLVPWGVAKMEEAFISWVKNTKKLGFKICLVSNAKQVRAQNFAKLLDIPAVGLALKPFGRAFKKGMSLLGLSAPEVAVIGDQLFTDVLGGNCLKIHTILINPLGQNELEATKIMRKIEAKILRKMVENGQVSPQHAQIRQGGNSHE